jgi:hypothetical protein
LAKRHFEIGRFLHLKSEIRDLKLDFSASQRPNRLRENIRRMREFGIRIALGAERKEVLEAALGRAFKLLAFGSAAGLVLGILASRVLALIVYQRVLFSLCLCWGCSLREE